jgi:hypothetical protein
MSALIRRNSLSKTVDAVNEAFFFGHPTPRRSAAKLPPGSLHVRDGRAHTAISSRDSMPNARLEFASSPANESRQRLRVTSWVRNRVARCCCSTAATHKPRRH